MKIKIVTSGKVVDVIQRDFLHLNKFNECLFIKIYYCVSVF